MLSGKANFPHIFWVYLRLGCICFGGPIAHLGYFKDEFVTRRAWLSEARYAELLGLCQFVPGPSSSQLGFAIGWQRGGLWGGCAAWLGFTLPSALLMVVFAYGLFAMGAGFVPFVHGLLVAAVAVVANAIIGLGKKTVPRSHTHPDRPPQRRHRADGALQPDSNRRHPTRRATR